MEILQDGSFEFNIDIAKGLRPSKRSPRNKDYLTTCKGAVGLDGVLQVIDDLQPNKINTTGLVSASFPFPQLFVLANVTLVCGRTRIYEYASGALTLQYTAAPGDLWEVVDFHSFLYLSNGTVAVTKDTLSGAYTASSLYIADAMCNFNGQVIVARVES